MIFAEVKIDMNNTNALVTIAYISQSNGNPYAVFCEYIKYCLTISTSKWRMVGDLKQDLEREFGILFPQNVLLRCLNFLQQEGFLSIDRHQICTKGTFDTDAFEAKRRIFREEEDYLVQMLVTHVEKLGKVWTAEYARSALGDFLRMNGNAFDIFYNSELQNVEKSDGQEESPTENATGSTHEGADDAEPVVIPDRWYVSNFARHILDNDLKGKTYLEDVSKGLMMCIGAYQIQEEESERGNKAHPIKDTAFYFDTKLILRILGCAWTEAVESTKELVKLIQAAGGNIFYFPQTYQEVIDALEKAEDCVNRNVQSGDREMAYYLLHNHVSASAISAKKESVKGELSNLGIHLRQLQSWSETERLKYAISQADLEGFIRSAQPQWEPIAVANDVEAVYEIQMLRKGNYETYYGGGERLPVFVTSNTRLVSLAMEYKNARPGEKRIFGWRSNRLPLITDVRLTCRLWNPARDGNNLPTMQLAANVIAAQQPSREYYEHLKKTVDEMIKVAPAYAGIPLSEYCDDVITERIVVLTGGDIDRLSAEMLASTLDELTEMNAAEEHKKLVAEENAHKVTKADLDKQTQGLIDAAIERNKDKFGCWPVLIWMSRKWEWVIGILFAIIGAAVGLASQNWGLMGIVVIPGVIKIVELIMGSKMVSNWLLGLILPRATAWYVSGIQKRLSPVEMQYRDKIVNGCLDNNSWLSVKEES